MVLSEGIDAFIASSKMNIELRGLSRSNEILLPSIIAYHNVHSPIRDDVVEPVPPSRWNHLK